MGYARSYRCASRQPTSSDRCLEKLIRSRTAPHRDVQRARALLMAADGFANTRIATRGRGVADDGHDVA